MVVCGACRPAFLLLFLVCCANRSSAARRNPGAEERCPKPSPSFRRPSATTISTLTQKARASLPNELVRVRAVVLICALSLSPCYRLLSLFTSLSIHHRPPPLSPSHAPHSGRARRLPRLHLDPVALRPVGPRPLGRVPGARPRAPRVPLLGLGVERRRVRGRGRCGVGVGDVVQPAVPLRADGRRVLARVPVQVGVDDPPVPACGFVCRFFWGMEGRK